MLLVAGKSLELKLKRSLKIFCSQPEAKRRTVIQAAGREVEINAEDFIVAEDCHVLITKDGWVKRQRTNRGPRQKPTTPRGRRTRLRGWLNT